MLGGSCGHRGLFRIFLQLLHALDGEGGTGDGLQGDGQKFYGAVIGGTDG